MNRRRFLSYAGGALGSASLVGQSLNADSNGPLWSHPKHLVQSAVCSVPDPPPPALPPQVKAERFQLPKTKVLFRKNWSELKSDRKYTECLKTGYTALVKGGSKSWLAQQMALHNFYCAGKWTPPGGSKQVDIHHTWYFLPWHRAFLYFHERALQKALCDDDFRLPAWDWEKSAAIPGFYRELGLPSFLPATCARSSIKNPDQFVDPCILKAWLWSGGEFERFCGGAPGCDLSSQASGGPHVSIHTRIVQGPMTSSETAAGDPVFYSHHANVDRFWSHWMRQPQQQIYPAQDAELWKQAPMYFYDEKGCLVEVRPIDLMCDETLGYKYEPLQSPSFSTANLKPSEFQKLLGGDEGEILELKQLFKERHVPSKGPSNKTIAEFFSGRNRQLCIPGQLRLTVKGSDLKPGEYYIIRLRCGNKSANIGGFGVFSHIHGDQPQIAVSAAIPVKILEPLLKRLGGGPHLCLEYGQLEAESTADNFQNYPIKSGTEHKIQMKDLFFSVLVG